MIGVSRASGEHRKNIALPVGRGILDPQTPRGSILFRTYHGECKGAGFRISISAILRKLHVPDQESNPDLLGHGPILWIVRVILPRQWAHKQLGFCPPFPFHVTMRGWESGGVSFSSPSSVSFPGRGVSTPSSADISRSLTVNCWREKVGVLPRHTVTNVHKAEFLMRLVILDTSRNMALCCAGDSQALSPQEATISSYIWQVHAGTHGRLEV